MNKHTPGPWSLYGEPESIRIEGPREGKSHLVLVERVGGRRRGKNYSDLSELVANAKLIAAAPDLLSELRETHAALCFTADYIGSERYKRNAAAIAKATQ